MLLLLDDIDLSIKKNKSNILSDVDSNSNSHDSDVDLSWKLNKSSSQNTSNIY